MKKVSLYFAAGFTVVVLAGVPIMHLFLMLKRIFMIKIKPVEEKNVIEKSKEAELKDKEKDK